MALLNPSIEKLQKKLDKDPNSLAFVQLVEEYRKEGNYEAALEVCQEGLRRHPNYWSARVALGRIYHQTHSTDLARQELEKVIRAVPDNLLANKLLGDIYSMTGQFQDALERYRIVQMVTPNDQEVLGNIQRIESQLPVEESPNIPAVGETPIVEPETQEEEIPEPEVAQDEIPAIESAPQEAIAVPELVSGEELIPESHGKMETETVEAEAVVWSALEDSGTEDEASDIAEMASLFLQPEAEAEAEETPTSLTEELHQDDLASPEPLSFSTVQMENETSDSSTPTSVSFRTVQIEQEGEVQSQSPDTFGEVDEADELTTETLAELYMQQGMTDKAAKIYEKLLLNNPNSSEIAQKLRELNSVEAPVVSEAPILEGGKRIQEPEENFDAPDRSEELDHRAQERRRKILTLENWLATIRRDRQRSL